MRIERALPERDTSPISRLIEAMGPREQVFVANMNGEFAGFAGIAPRWSYSERLSHCGEGGPS